MTNLLNNAISKHEILDIVYIDKKGVRSSRTVEPYEIKGGKLYAYCLNKDSIRAFIITSINSVKPTGNIFTPRF